MATIETALTRLLGITHPILLAPMGSAAGGKLAVAARVYSSGDTDIRHFRRSPSDEKGEA